MTQEEELKFKNLQEHTIKYRIKETRKRLKELRQLKKETENKIKEAMAQIKTDKASLESLKEKIDGVLFRIERNSEIEDRRNARRAKAIYLDDLLHGVLPECNKQYAFLILLSLVQDDFPWVYNMGKGLIDIINSRVNNAKKITAINDFRRLMMFSFEHPALRENVYRRNDSAMLLKEVPYLLSDLLIGIEKDLE